MHFYAFEEKDTTLHGLLCEACCGKEHAFDPQWVLLEDVDYTKCCDRCEKQVSHLLYPELVPETIIET